MLSLADMKYGAKGEGSGTNDQTVIGGVTKVFDSKG
jgi:hypothetical protein